MFQSKTLFIVGAGASKEAGLPVGEELKGAIAKAIDIKYDDWGSRRIQGDELVANAIIKHMTDSGSSRRDDMNPYLRAGWMIKEAMPQAISIDNFIDAHRENKTIGLIGKLGIVRCILEAEKRSALFIDPQKNEKLKFLPLSKTWYSAMFQLATESIPKADAQQSFDNLSFITFNYDRCIEHFLVQALKNYYGFDDAEAQKIAQEVPSIHPYGQVGCLPWQLGKVRVPFGGSEYDRGDELLSVSAQIKTFTETVEDGADLKAMRQRVQEAETIIFLGFAFHPQNMALIAPGEPARAKRVFGTAKGMSKPDTEAVADDIHSWLRSTPEQVKVVLRNDLTCFDLFNEFRRSMPRAVS